MGSFDRSFAAAVRHTARLDAALADWEFNDDGATDELPGEIVDSVWTGELGLFEDRDLIELM